MPTLPKALDLASFRENYTILLLYDVIESSRETVLCFSGGGEFTLYPGNRSVFNAFDSRSEARRLRVWDAVTIRPQKKPRVDVAKARRFEKESVEADQAVQYLVEILKTPIGEVTVDHRLAQSYDAKSGKIELPNKLGAMQQLAKMCGSLDCSSTLPAGVRITSVRNSRNRSLDNSLFRD